MSLRVHVATGATVLREVDLFLPGYIPLELARCYRSDHARRGMLGWGWTFNYDVALDVGDRHIVYRDASDREIYFKPIATDVQVTHPEAGWTLQHHGDAYIVFASPLLRQVFLKKNASGKTLRLDHIEDLNGNRLQLLYKGNHLIGFIDTVGRQVHCTYANDRLASIQAVGPASAEKHTIRSFRYDAQGDLVAVADEARREAHYAYADHLMTAATNRLGGVEHAQYDARRRCLALWRGDGSGTRLLAYDDLRQTTRVVDANGEQHVYRYVGTQVLAHTGPLGHTQDYYYDVRQHLIGCSDGEGNIASFHHLDHDAGTLTHIDAGRLALFEFDEQGRATTASDGANDYTLAYDDRGNLTELTTPTGAEWSFERDAKGRAVQVNSPEGRLLRVVYSKDGRQRAIEDDLGRCYEETVDALGRLLEREDALGRKEQCTYDAAGRLTTVKIDGAYEVRFTYDAAGHLTAVTDSRHRNFKLQYDAFGRLLSRTGPKSQRKQYHYDGEGRLVTAQVQGKKARFDYDGQGRLVHVESSDAAAWTYRYEADGGIVEQRANAATRFVATSFVEEREDLDADGAGRTYEYGLAGELVAATWDAGEAAFVYDEEGRLATVQVNEDVLTLAYDRDGNLTTIDEDGTPITLRYDQRGRVVEAQVAATVACRFSYDAGNRLTALAPASGGRFTFAYDRLDRLEGRTWEADGQSPEYHRFRTKDLHPWMDRLPESPGEDVADAAPDGGEDSWAVLYQTRHGLILAIRRGDLELPIWFQDHYFFKGETGLSQLMVHAVLNGIDAVLQGRALATGPELLRRWVRAAHERIRIDYTEVPRLHEVAPLWRGLDPFFLTRAFYDSTQFRQRPGYLPYQEDYLLLSGDDGYAGIYGAHQPPRAWDDRAVEEDLRFVSPAIRRTGLRPDDADLFFVDQP